MRRWLPFGVKKPPTDYELLRAIYWRHRGEYLSQAQARHAARTIVPIDLPAIADDLGSDADTVFGRLYFHLDPQYESTTGTGARKHLFMPKAGDHANCINFPLLEAVLAGLWQQRRRDLWTLWIAVVSLGIALGSLVVAVVAVTTT